MTNTEFAETLNKLAEVYASSELSLSQPGLRVFAYEKRTALDLIRAVGGKWIKNMGDADDPYPDIEFKSERIPGLRILLPRASVLWNCEPFMKPEEEAELLEASK